METLNKVQKRAQSFVRERSRLVKEGAEWYRLLRGVRRRGRWELGVLQKQSKNRQRRPGLKSERKMISNKTEVSEKGLLREKLHLNETRTYLKGGFVR